jgi:hypothetical protein
MSVTAVGLASALLGSSPAMAQFNQSKIKGLYASSFQINLNDSNTSGLFVPDAGLLLAIHTLGADLGKKGQCPNVSFPGGLSAKTVSAVLKGDKLGPGDIVYGSAQTRFDGAGSIVGEGVFNVFLNRSFSKLTDIQQLNPVNSGFTILICGGPNAATLDQRCAPVCNTASASPYNCGLQYKGSGTGHLNDGGGGYVTAAEGFTT